MEDIIQEILLHLPPKSLGRCKLLSKRWYAFISQNHAFRQNYLSKNSSAGMMLGFFLCSANGEVAFLPTTSHGKKINTMLIPLDDSLSFTEHESFYIHGSSNGFLLYCQFTPNGRKYFICNPVTKQWVPLPPTPPNDISNHHITHGFIFHVTTSYPRVNRFHHYTLVHALKSDHYSTTLKVEILSTKEAPDEWKRMDLTAPFPIKLLRKWKGHVVITEQGVIYLLASVLGRNNSISAVVFDPRRSSNSLEIIESPCQPDEHLKLFGKSGSDILFGTSDHDMLKVWVLSEFINDNNGVQCLTRKWSLRYNVNFEIPRECYPSKFIRFIGFHPLNPNILFARNTELLFLFDIPKSSFELVCPNEEAVVGQGRQSKCFITFPYTYGLIGPPLFHDD